MMNEILSRRLLAKIAGNYVIYVIKQKLLNTNKLHYEKDGLL